MNLKATNKTETNKYELEVEISAEDFNKALSEVAKTEGKKMSVPGFRKGHAPRMVIEAAYGKHVFFEDAVEDMFPDIYKDTVRLPNGKTSTREYTVHHGAVCILPLLENGDVLLERQFRYAMGEVLTEIPAGKLDYIGEDPHEAALRELREETGAVASELIPLGPFYPTCAYSTEVIHMYLARQLTFGERELDEDEFLNVFRLPLRELVEKVLNGEIPDAKTQAAALRVWCMLQEGKLS